ncbi:MAG: hypothetical protein Kow0031_06430 [Anaerolineae bacterium]
MEPTAINSILKDRKIVYLTTDADFHVTARYGDRDMLRQISAEEKTGGPVWASVPELVGCEAALKDVLAGTLPRFELAWVNRDRPTGETLYFDLVVLPLADASGPGSGLVVILQDVSDTAKVNQLLAQSRNDLRLLQRTLLEKNEALAAANSELEHLSSLKTLFVSIAAHELRTPLTSIIGYLEMVLDGVYGPLTANQRHGLEVASRGATRVKNITDKLLMATRIETGNIETFPQRIDLPKLVNQVLTEFELQVAAKGQQLAMTAAGNLPPALCDLNLTCQVIANLVSNAVKYTPPGGEISVLVEQSSEGRYLQLVVADNGPGISAEGQRQLFKRFSRIGDGLYTKTEGTGLGLYITRSLVEIMNGRVWVDSEPGRGSRFFVAIPVANDPRQRAAHLPAPDNPI